MTDNKWHCLWCAICYDLWVWLPDRIAFSKAGYLILPYCGYYAHYYAMPGRRYYATL